MSAIEHSMREESCACELCAVRLASNSFIKGCSTFSFNRDTEQSRTVVASVNTLQKCLLRSKITYIATMKMKWTRSW